MIIFFHTSYLIQFLRYKLSEAVIAGSGRAGHQIRLDFIFIFSEFFSKRLKLFELKYMTKATYKWLIIESSFASVICNHYKVLKWWTHVVLNISFISFSFLTNFNVTINTNYSIDGHVVFYKTIQPWKWDCSWSLMDTSLYIPIFTNCLCLNIILFIFKHAFIICVIFTP